MRLKIILTVFMGVIVFAGGLAPEATAGLAGPGSAACVVDNPGGTTLKGTVSVRATEFTGEQLLNVDVTLLLDAPGGPVGFRTFLATAAAGTALELGCAIVSALQPQVLAAFGFSSSRTIVLSKQSINDTDGLGFTVGTVVTGMADIRINVQ